MILPAALLVVCVPSLPASAAVAEPHTRIYVDANLTSGLSLRSTETASPGVAFTLDRAEIGGGFILERTYELVLRVESIRSAGEQSAFGIDGNSLLPRVKHAWAGVTPSFTVADIVFDLQARAGMVPEPWLARLEPLLDTRGLLPLASERAGLLDNSDLGAALGLSAAGGLVALDVSLRNGEGKREVELNVDKDLVVVLSGAGTIADVGGPLSLQVQAMWRQGTRGIASANEQRAGFAIAASHPRMHLGTELLWAQGLGGDPQNNSGLAGAWADVIVIERWLGLAMRGEAGLTNPRVEEGGRGAMLAAAFTDLGISGEGGLRRLRAYGGVEGVLVQQNAAIAGVPEATNYVRAFVQLEACGLTNLLAQ